ncbi:PREDICTED: neuroblastoma-amplified sequence-like [Amphimedon queenslandica]|uniref:non-specific serine/threonine protein kinase n=1 Tax=Amphimedon queenslandica TaxID=400682 RepID=A0AAN0JEB8_AMPQE|nr:PREDICTED: neuroblastoma-amplified sequence-like [Amphimedon queenslandica]|eukprot:XP_019855102.1 PREDICTED: neuroblastoma-amplified sequence-like [Amphimedon queenslandica]
MTALSGMCFASSNTSTDSTLLIVMSYEAQITTYCLKQNKRYILLHSVSLLDYFPYGAGGIQYLSNSNVIVIAGCSDAKEPPLVSCWRLVNDSPYWIPAADNKIEKSKRGAFQSLVNKKVFNDDWVYSVSLSPSGSLLATLSLSGSICLWDLPSCRLKSTWLPEELPGSNESHVMSTSFGFETKASRDFGMAQLLKDNDHGASFRGSPLYMAPEVMLGKTYDAKVDLWSIGVILFEILYGFAPYHSSTIEELHLRVLNDTPIVIPSVPETSSKCKEVFQGLLERDPCQRDPCP